MRGNGWAVGARGPALLGVDLAGGAVTSVVTDPTGRVLARAGARVALSRPRPGWVEADPLDWLAAAIVTIRRAVDEAGVRPQAIGLSGLTEGLVLVDAAGVPVRPAILRPDTRAVSRLAAYRDLPAGVRRNLVNPPRPVAGPMLSWVAAEQPGSYARARRALQPKDWLRGQLTGEHRTEPSDASGTLLYDLVDARWSGDAVLRLGLDPGRLPEILPGAGHQAGLLTRSGADLVGLIPGTPVAAGAARTCAAALGAGLVGGDDAQVVLGPRPYVVTSIPALPAALPPTGGLHVLRAATDRGWCVTASVPDAGPGRMSDPGVAGPDDDGRPERAARHRVRRLAGDLAAAVRAVRGLAPVSRIQVRGAGSAPAELLAALTELVDLPVTVAALPDPAARAAALLGARAAGLLGEETLGAHVAAQVTVESQ